MNPKIKQFIEDNKNLIELDKWEEIYKEANSSLNLNEIGAFTYILIDADINPLEYIDYVPMCFLYSQDIPSFKIPDHIKNIDKFAFFNTSITSIAIPDSVTSIGYSAFRYCTSLTSVTIGDGVTSIGDNAFSWCTSLKNITFNGTKEQWRTISKEINWSHKVSSSCKVYCTDVVLKI